MDATRKQLDDLLGANRDGDGEKVTAKYYDRNVCRHYLAGLCPREIFHPSKIVKEPCYKTHSLQLRKEYEEAKAKGLDNYDWDLEDNIERLIAECDRKIANDAKRVAIISVSEITQTPDIIELSKKIKAKLKEADQSDLEGKTDLKNRALEEIGKLRNERAKMQAKLIHDAFSKDQAPLPQPLTNAPQLAPAPAGVPDPSIVKMINKKLKEAQDLGEQGMVDEAQKAAQEAEAHRKLLLARQKSEGGSSKNTAAADVRVAKLIHDAFSKDQAPLPQPLTKAPQLAPAPAGVPDPSIVKMINKKLKEAQDLGEQGMVDEAQKAAQEAEAHRKLLLARQKSEGGSSKNTAAADVRVADQKFRICDICGAFLNVYDSDLHLADHLGGRPHIGYMKIREKLAELQEEKEKKHRARSEDRRSRGRDGGDSRDYHGRDRDRDRRIRDRGNDRERERERIRYRSYDSRSRRRSRSRSRSRA